jgi:hypothetical protein
MGEQLQFPEASDNSSRDEKLGAGTDEPPTAPPQAAPREANPPTRRAAAELLTTQGALLTRSHLRELGLQRRAVDAVFRALPVIALPGYSRPMIRADDYLALVEKHTYGDDRVRSARP